MGARVSNWVGRERDDKKQHKGDPCGDRTVLYLDDNGGSANLHVIK